MNILVINGPNLNMLGKREIDIYGNKSYDDLVNYINTEAKLLACSAFVKQTNHEGVIIDLILEANDIYDGIILNAGAYTHYSYAIYDAIKSIDIPVVEVHLSDITKREDFRKVSVLSSACIKTIMGKGFSGYKEAITLLKGVKI